MTAAGALCVLERVARLRSAAAATPLTTTTPALPTAGADYSGYAADFARRERANSPAERSDRSDIDRVQADRGWR